MLQREGATNPAVAAVALGDDGDCEDQVSCCGGNEHSDMVSEVSTASFVRLVVDSHVERCPL